MPCQKKDSYYPNTDWSARCRLRISSREILANDLIAMAKDRCHRGLGLGKFRRTLDTSTIVLSGHLNDSLRIGRQIQSIHIPGVFRRHHGVSTERPPEFIKEVFSGQVSALLHANQQSGHTLREGLRITHRLVRILGQTRLGSAFSGSDRRPSRNPPPNSGRLPPKPEDIFRKTLPVAL